MMPLPLVQSSTEATPTNPSSLAKPLVVDVSKGYSSVNKLSLLPDEVRTAENLEGDTIPVNKEEELLLQYQKQRADYEEKQLLKMTELKAKREAELSPKHEPEAFGATVVARPATPPYVGGDGYETVSGSAMGRGGGGGRGPDPYEDPADAVLGKPASGGAARGGRAPGAIDPYEDPADTLSHIPEKVDVPVKSGNSPVQHAKTMKVGVSELGEEYTPVFNSLPRGKAEKVITPKTARAVDTTPTSKASPSTSKASPSHQNSPQPPAGGVVGDSSPGSEASGGDKSSPGQAGEGRTEFSRGQDGSRHSNRKMSKEVVEFDPNKQRKFRVTSSMKKRSNGKKSDGADQTDGSHENSQSEDGSQHPVDQKGELSYAMVNMVDKKKNRVQPDANKVEGSGTPQHYRVPLISSS